MSTLSTETSAPRAEHGQIASYADFTQQLERARGFAAKQSNEIEPSVLNAISEQLDAMRKWSANGQVPTSKQRQSICVGLIAARELGQLTTQSGVQFVQWLHELNNYFEDWP